eukprot:CAMPEP_0174990296 /NCGR_PEP_ID=MMETSP0004_2-20121128/21235_1 /TAXON_ID=420556 /ORGANISM="Ochromonas sp., Strain CCMP1393" /LENGTH=1178 /DNA_ID=CAMNT_0016243873 /DNA_START=248 /DNA_END=3785 /DNA_ORIENTATION=-
MNGLANAFLVIKLVSVDDSAGDAPPPKKGAPAEITPKEEVLIQLTIPFHALLTSQNASMNLLEPLNELLTKTPFCDTDPIVHPSVITEKTSLVLKLAGDNDLAEYVLGSKVLMWSGAQFDAPPAAWTLQSPDVADPKAKVPPTAEEFRAKYLENVPKLVEDQGTLCSFEISVGGTKGAAPAEEAGPEAAAEGAEAAVPEPPLIHSMIPTLSLAAGKISFNETVAGEVTMEEDIRAREDLWSITWGASAVIFMHRSVARRFTLLLLQDRAKAYLPMTVKRIPTAAAAESQGGELVATALDISSITNTGETAPALTATLPMPMPMQGEGRAPADTSARHINGGFAALSKEQSDIPAGLLSSQVVSAADPNRDIMKELRAEISSTIEKIGQEYVSLYPEPTKAPTTLVAAAGNPSAGGSVNAGEGEGAGGSAAAAGSPRASDAPHPQTQEERKIEFLAYLKDNGLFHDLRVNLKPKVQLLIREKYGNRGRALGKSQAIGTIDLNRGGDEEKFDDVTQEINEASVEAVLSELYVFLLKECSLVLNSMFTDTIIDRDASELEKNAYINDQEETKMQTVSRLLNQAADAAANRAFEIADMLHLERIQIINHTPALASDIDILHTAYASYGKFLLEWSATVLATAGAAASSEMQAVYVEKAQDVLNKAREALGSAYRVKPTAWEIALLYGGILVELQQEEQAEQVLLDVIRSQISSNSSREFSMESFSEFDGYESDALIPVDPKCYSTLAALFSLQSFPMKSRKALLLANRSFAEGGYLPHVSKHGSPRRTIVLTLAQTGLYLFKYSLVRLGQACVSLAGDSEAAVTAKATARGKPATTVPHIKYLLKQVQSVAALYGASSSVVEPASSDRLDKAVLIGKESQMVADEAEDEVQAWTTVARALQFSGADAPAVVDAYLNAIGCSRKLPLELVKSAQTVSLEVFIQSGRLLLLGGRFNQARTVLLYACKVYSSATLFMLLGVCYLRLDELVDAEDVLVEANLLDNRHADVWAYLCLVCLASGPHRLAEAEKSLEQTLRLGQEDAQLLREMATSFMSVDKLQTAEDLIRRALRKEMQESSASGSGGSDGGGGGSSSKYASNARTRRLLADVLAGQNQAVKAVEEYQLIIADEHADLKTKLEAAERCSDLLSSLGREEELVTLKSIIATLSEPQPQQGEAVPSQPIMS